MIPPTRYINAGPLAPQASAGPAMAAGQAVEQIGHAIENAGEQGSQLVAKMRRMKEGGAINAFMANADKEAGEFSIGLARRSDTDAWPKEWQDRTADLRERGKALGLSPEGMARLDGEFSNWSTGRAIHFETQAATKSLGIAKAQTTQSLEYYAARGDKEGFERTKRTGVASGILNPADEQAAQMHFDERSAALDLDKLAEGNPQGLIDEPDESILKTLPGATPQMVSQAKRQAEHGVQERRGDQMDLLETKLLEGKLDPKDIEAAEFLTKKDALGLRGAMDAKTPPSQESHSKAWTHLDKLRKARNSAAITPEQYRSLYNDARGQVLSEIPPQWQGDLKQELSYLSPAGRSEPSKNGVNLPQPFDPSDLFALGRESVGRALQAGVFGDVTPETPFLKREAAHRKADEIRLEIKRFVATFPDAGPEKVRAFTDSLIGVKIDGESSILPPVPGAISFDADIDRIMGMRGLPDLEPGPGGSSAALLPPKQ